MKSLIAILVLGVFVSADMHRTHSMQFSIANVLKVNVEDDHRIIAGNEKGEIEVHTGGRSAKSRVISGVHSAPIMYIEQYQRNRSEEYVVVDSSGLVSIWNRDLTLQLASLSFNGSASNAAIREKCHSVVENTLAINFGGFIVELSLDSRKQLRRYDQNVTFLSLVYTEKTLIVSTDNAQILYFDTNGTLISSSSTVTSGNVQLLSRHNHDGSYDSSTAIGIANSLFLVHIANSKIDLIHQISTEAVTSLNYCKGRMVRKGERREGRRSHGEDLIVVGVGSSKLQLRDLNSYFQTLTFDNGVVDIACNEEDLFILHNGGQLELVELEHHEHSDGKTSAIAAVLLIVLVLAVVGYQIAKRRGKREGRQACAQTEGGSNEIELREYMLRGQGN